MRSKTGGSGGAEGSGAP
uniref:Uncharacterized protein n=1 Tax=Arundo donax TaxID=35708 RepID=A0A0A8XNY0_ARUDO